MTQASDVTKIREAMNEPIGKIIKALIGDDRLKGLYDDQKLPPELVGKSSLDIVMALKLTPPAVTTALLVGQAAERIARLAEKSEVLQEKGRKAVKGSYLAPDDSVFKFVGSDRDPPMLKAAQATWLVAQMYLNDQVQGNEWFTAVPADNDGLRKEAVGYFQVAAKMLDQAGYPDAAKKLGQAAESVEKEIKNQKAPTAKAILEKLAQAENGAYYADLQDQRLLGRGEDGASYKKGYDPDSIKRLQSLMEQKETSATPAPAVKKPSKKQPGLG